MNEPICKLGYPESQLRQEMSEKTFKEFMKWMRGQTFSSCEGWFFDHELNKTVPSHCGPHGYVYYAWDVNRFMIGAVVID